MPCSGWDIWIYPHVPNDVYRRHHYCYCTAEYNPGDGKRQDVWKNSKKKKELDYAEKLKERNELANIGISKSEKLRRFAYAKASELLYDPILQEKILKVGLKSY